MKKNHKNNRYTILLVPEGMGEPRAIKVSFNYKRLMSTIVLSVIMLVVFLGVLVNKQTTALENCYVLLNRQEAEIVLLKTSEKQLKEERMLWVQNQNENKIGKKSSMMLHEPKALASSPRVNQLQEKSGKVEDILAQYSPTFKPCEGEVTSRFGQRENPFGRKTSDNHKGIDIANEKGTPIYASASGVVEEARYVNGYGYAVYIDHGNGVQTRYGHNTKLFVKKGDEVKKGQLIAKMGSTGNSTGNHLHFEILENGEQVNPEYLFD